jgi:hypothetical protein
MVFTRIVRWSFVRSCDCRTWDFDSFAESLCLRERIENSIVIKDPELYHAKAKFNDIMKAIAYSP